MIFALFLICFENSQAMDKVGELPERIIYKLFKVHRPQINKPISFDDKDTLLQFFTPTLTSLLLRDIECRKRTHEICNLDFDPIFGAQDFENSPLNLMVKRIGTNGHRYKVTFTNITRRTLIYELKRTNNGWRIRDIIYPDGKSLRTILSRHLN